MITKLTEQKGCIIAEFIDLKRFTLAVTEEVKSELKPILSQEGNKMIFDFKNIEFIDSSGIGCIISLVKTAKSNHSEIKYIVRSHGRSGIITLTHDSRYRTRLGQCTDQFLKKLPTRGLFYQIELFNPRIACQANFRLANPESDTIINRDSRFANLFLPSKTEQISNQAISVVFQNYYICL